jgi:hypothetical protein
MASVHTCAATDGDGLILNLTLVVSGDDIDQIYKI